MTPAPQIRALDRGADAAAVADLFRRSADCVRLERGEAPGPELTDEFFTGVAPGCDRGRSLKLGLSRPGAPLLGIADVSFGFPEPDDAYLGLLQLATEARGAGHGRAFLRGIEAACRTRQARRLFIAVLDANPRGRAFWDREGFAVALANRPVTLGQRQHIATRMVKPL